MEGPLTCYILGQATLPGQKTLEEVKAILEADKSLQDEEGEEEMLEDDMEVQAAETENPQHSTENLDASSNRRCQQQP